LRGEAEAEGSVVSAAKQLSWEEYKSGRQQAREERKERASVSKSVSEWFGFGKEKKE
jgi:hypothetical protein